MPAVTLSRLEALLSKSTDSFRLEPTEPVALRELNVRLDEIHGRGLVVSSELLATTLRKLSAEGVGSLDAGDDLVLSNGFLQPHPLLGDVAPCMTAEVRGPLLRRWQTQLENGVLAMLLWRAACMAYFLVEERDVAADLRQFLDTGRKQMAVLDRKPAWLSFFLAHENRGLFTDRPGKELARQWFAGNETLAEAIREHAELPESSWLWEEMLVEIVRKVQTLSREAFVPQVRNLLELSRQYPRQRDRIYAVMVENYVRYNVKEDVPASLIEAVIDGWGNPQMERVDAAHRWSNVSENARIWMCQLLAEKDLADFFELISKGSKAGLSAMDTRRLQFWRQYTSHMKYTRLVLGDGFFNSTNGSVRTFVANRRKRLGRLIGDPENAAFLMRVGDCWCIEFSQTGNALYSYRIGQLPFDPQTADMRTSDMRSRDLADERVTHGGFWEERLADYLGNVISRSVCGQGGVGYSSSGALNDRSSHGFDLKCEGSNIVFNSISEKLTPAVRSEFGLLFLRQLDSRNKKGMFWIELSGRPSRYLELQMEGLGFKYKPGRGFYQ